MDLDLVSDIVHGIILGMILGIMVAIMDGTTRGITEAIMVVVIITITMYVICLADMSQIERVVVARAHLTVRAMCLAVPALETVRIPLSLIPMRGHSDVLLQIVRVVLSATTHQEPFLMKIAGRSAIAVRLVTAVPSVAAVVVVASVEAEVASVAVAAVTAAVAALEVTDNIWL